MIKRINSIRDFGILKDFNWNNDLPEFNERNIIYGWNYTGKTTLSRIFSSLRDKQMHKNYQNSQFKLTFGPDNKELTQDNIGQSPLRIQVFNSEYVKENLKWDTDDELEGIEFDVGENVKLREKINKNVERIENIDSKKIKLQPEINKFNDLEATKISREAKKIKNDIFNSLIEFNKTHFKKIMNQIKNNPDDFIISDKAELNSIKATSIATDNKQPIDEIKFIDRINNLSREIFRILETKPEETEIIGILEEDKELYEWSKQGYKLHQQKSIGECAFCGSIINSKKMQELNNYFSNASGKLRQEINECRNAIIAEEEKLDNMKIPNSKNDFIDNYKNQAKELLNQQGIYKRNYKNLLQAFSEDLDRKENGNIFNAINQTKYNHSAKDELTKWIDSINQTIRRHNDFINNFNDNQYTARNELQKHLVVSFLISEDYYNIENRKNHSERCIRRYKCLQDKISNKNSELEGDLKSIIAGQNKLNEYITRFLGNDNIKIKTTSNDKFVLKRGNELANNLSEGEKTAISFAYFLVSLESLHKDNKLKETIVFIDDPISSLDANHIAQVYSLINHFFFRQNEDPNNPKEYVSCFKQLFISTHNFDFFSFLRDSNKIIKKKKHEFYFLKRTTDDSACIQNMPKPLKKNKSEYIYLFSIIHNYYRNGCQESDDNLILLPNAVRRFLEIYTLIKLPGFEGEVDKRLEILASGENQLKTLHHFSHFTSFDKLTKHDELIMNLPSIVGELMSLLKEDGDHFSSLTNTVN